MSKKVSTLFSLMVLLTLVLSACGGATPAATEPPATAVPPTTAPPTAEPTATTEPTAAPEEVFPPEVKAVITITLPADSLWSDGTPLTTKDVVGTWDILWMRKSGTWNSLVNVVAKDDQTVQF
jgi:ABC-type transport system substrate-binding protein